MSTVYLQANNPISGVAEPLLFTYTPVIEYNHDVKYDAYQLTHTNYQPNAYARSENPQINLTAKFSAHTTAHFRRSEYALRFLRTYTKMNYGRQDPQKGQPPRILRFFAYGSMIFNNVPVLISKFSATFPDDVDYVMGVYDSKDQQISPTFAGGGQAPSTVKTYDGYDGFTGADRDSEEATRIREEARENLSWAGPGTESPLWLPAIFTLNISLLVQQNTYQTVTTFSLDKFSEGQLYNRGYI